MEAQGRQLFDSTPRELPTFVRARLSCTNCHINSGTQAGAAPLFATAARFPAFSKRAGKIIGLRERIQECFVRSENARPVPSPVLTSMAAYLRWLHAKRPNAKRQALKIKGPQRPPSRIRGAVIYADDCWRCHGGDGGGGLKVPPLWGPQTFNDGAGMSHANKMAAFVHHNMPADRPGTLSRQQAWDVAAYVLSHQRPQFNKAYARY